MRIYGSALGYEDLKDHEELREDLLLAMLIEESVLAGELLTGKYVEPYGIGPPGSTC